METKSDTCPNCGYCPHCGRGGYRTYPYYPHYPSYPWWGYYQGTTTGDYFPPNVTITCKADSNG